jgi:hypothetical protein
MVELLIKHLIKPKLLQRDYAKKNCGIKYKSNGNKAQPLTTV